MTEGAPHKIEFMFIVELSITTIFNIPYLENLLNAMLIFICQNEIAYTVLNTRIFPQKISLRLITP